MQAAELLSIIEQQTADREEYVTAMWPVAVSCAVQLAQSATAQPDEFKHALSSLMTEARTTALDRSSQSSTFYITLSLDEAIPDGIRATFAALSEAHSPGHYADALCDTLCNVMRANAAFGEAQKASAHCTDAGAS